MKLIDLLDSLGPDEPWQDSAACASADPEAFFSSLRADQALAVCAGCPVRVECDEYAETHDERFGIWGGKVRTA